MKKGLFSTALMLFFTFSSLAQMDVVEFESAEQQQLYQTLIKELRCLVCQNQNLADSNAELAQDLRRKTYEMVSEGKQYQEITDYMVERYGQFVLYRPSLSPSTYVLWLGPFVFLIMLIGASVYLVRKRKASITQGDQYSDAQIKHAQSLLRDKE